MELGQTEARGGHNLAKLMGPHQGCALGILTSHRPLLHISYPGHKQADVIFGLSLELFSMLRPPILFSVIYFVLCFRENFVFATLDFANFPYATLDFDISLLPLFVFDNYHNCHFVAKAK